MRIDAMFGELALWQSIPRLPQPPVAKPVKARPAIPDKRETVTFGRPCSKCGKPRDIGVYFGKRQHPYCKVCQAAYMRNWRKTNKMTPEQRRKDNCRSYAYTYLKRGYLEREPCNACGAEKAQMHHHDYSKPLEVEWLCRPCHLAEHYGPESFRPHVPGIQLSLLN